MNFNCPLLVEKEFDINDWCKEYDTLYKEFKVEYIDGNLSFFNIPIKFKRKPEVHGRHNSFYHMTTGHDGPIQTDRERVPDLKRIKKFYYPKILINNYNCNSGCTDCSGIFHWFSKKGNVITAYIYFDSIKYVVILEYRNGTSGEYFLFKTAYYVEYLRQRQIFLNNYSKNKDYNPFIK